MSEKTKSTETAKPIADYAIPASGHLVSASGSVAFKIFAFHSNGACDVSVTAHSKQGNPTGTSVGRVHESTLDKFHAAILNIANTK